MIVITEDGVRAIDATQGVVEATRKRLLQTIEKQFIPPTDEEGAMTASTNGSFLRFDNSSLVFRSDVEIDPSKFKEALSGSKGIAEELSKESKTIQYGVTLTKSIALGEKVLDFLPPIEQQTTSPTATPAS